MSDTTEATVETVETVEETKEEKRSKISEESQKRLMSIRDAGVQIRNAIGDLEIRKQELFVQHIGLKQQMEKEAEAALLDAGVDQGDLKSYRIDLKTGEFTR